jgi:hypothetical protein
MILQITEYCKWENERWGYLITLEKQPTIALTHLFIFMRLANDLYKHIEDNATTDLFAASNYHVAFFDKAEKEEEDNRIVLINSSHRIACRLEEGGYQSRTNVLLDKIISPAKVKSFMLAIRDKQENHIYKNFYGIFV